MRYVNYFYIGGIKYENNCFILTMRYVNGNTITPAIVEITRFILTMRYVNSDNKKTFAFLPDVLS